MKKVLLVAQAPSRTAGRDRALSGRSGQRLAAFADLSFPDEFFESFDTVNVLARWPGKHGGKYRYREKGDRFPIAAARRKARQITKTFDRYSAVVLCGSRVARAFDMKVGFFEWGELHGTPCVCIPHPSGVNQKYNDPATRLAARHVLREALAG